jgi:3-hydroxyisobutyrate dehydrogenase-like beta-hydroxyacid dehydrogenase
MRVGIAGLGRMGAAFSRRLLDADYELVVYNRSAGRAEEFVRRGALRVGAPVELWRDTPFVISMVSDSAALEELALGEQGLLATAPDEPAIFADMSTVSASSSQRIAAAAAEQGIAFLRAPVSGNPVAVAAGNLTIMVSGPREAYEKVEPILRAIGPSIYFLGCAEEARVMKLALNVMVAGTAQLMAECLTLGEAHGLARRAMLEAMGGSAVGSPFVKYKTPPLLEDDYSTTFSTSLMHKDLALALESAGSAGVPLPLTATVQRLLEACISSGLGELDFMALLLQLRREAGLGD